MPPHRLMLMDAKQPIRLDWLGLALELERCDRFGFDGLAHEPIRAGTQHDLARAGGLLEAGRDVHGIPGDQSLAGGCIAGDHLAGVDPDAKRDWRPASGRQLRVQRLDGRTDLMRSADGAEGVVLMEGWYP